MTECSYTIDGLLKNESYEFRVIAKNNIGTLGYASESTGPIECKTVIGKNNGTS